MTFLDQALPSRPASLKTTPLLIALLLGVCPAAAQADQVVSIGDGDTLSVMRGGRRVIVRLACIDAPESGQQPYGAHARSALQQLAPIGSEVSLRVQTTDRYGRAVAEVIRGLCLLAVHPPLRPQRLQQRRADR